jgi:hypothetical protein
MGFICGKITTITQIVLNSLHGQWLEVVNYIWRNDNFKIAIGVTNQILCSLHIKGIFSWDLLSYLGLKNIQFLQWHIKNWFLLWKVETSLGFEMEISSERKEKWKINISDEGISVRNPHKHRKYFVVSFCTY